MPSHAPCRTVLFFYNRSPVACLLSLSQRPASTSLMRSPADLSLASRRRTGIGFGFVACRIGVVMSDALRSGNPGRIVLNVAPPAFIWATTAGEMADPMQQDKGRHRIRQSGVQDALDLIQDRRSCFFVRSLPNVESRRGVRRSGYQRRRGNPVGRIYRCKGYHGSRSRTCAPRSGR